MKILKGIGIIIGSLIVLLLLIALFVKKEYRIEREVVVNAPKTDVFNYVSHLRNAEQYNKWVMTDPNMKKVYTGTDGTPGFKVYWDSEDDHVGEGEQEITRIAPGEKVDMHITFIRPFSGEAETSMTTESVTSNQTKVKWDFESGMKYPMNIMLLFFDMEDVLGKDLEASLQNLKREVER